MPTVQIDPNLFASLASSYVGGIEKPTPETAGFVPRVNARGDNIEYVDWSRVATPPDIVSAKKFWVQRVDGAEPIGVDFTSHVELYAAVGSGLVDDTGALQAAIAACPSYGTVDLGHGKSYLITALTINKALTLRMNGATIKLAARAAGTGTPGITITANDVTIQDGTIDGQRVLQPDDGWAEAIGSPTVVGAAYRAAIYAVSRTGLTVKDCTIIECAGGGVVTNNCAQVTVRDSRFSRLMYEAVMTYSNSATNRTGNVVRGCTVDQIGAVALGVCDEAGRTAYDTSADGIMMTNCDDATAYDNTITRTDFCAIKLENCRGGKIHSNKCKANYVGAYPGLQSYNSHSFKVYANTFDGYGGGLTVQGLYGVDAHDIEIFSNKICNIRDVVGTNNGVSSVGKVTRLRTHHNEFLDNPRVSGMQIACNGDTQKDIEFTDNIVKPCNLAAVYVSAAGAESVDGLVVARNKGGGTGPYAWQRGLMLEGDPGKVTRVVYENNEFETLQYDYHDNDDVCQAPEVSGARNACHSLKREIIAKRPQADVDLGGKDLRNFYTWHSDAPLALGADAAQAFPDKFFGTKYGSSKVIAGTFGLRVRIYTDASHAVCNSIDTTFDGAITTDVDGVASLTVNTPTPLSYDTSRVGVALAGAACEFTLVSNGFRVYATRPTGVACHATYTLWLDREDITA